MSWLSWNCSGFGNTRAIRALRELVCVQDLVVIFLCETRIQKNIVEAINRQCGFYGCFVVDPIGT